MDMDEGCPLGWAAAIEGLAPSLALYPASPVWFVPGGLRRAELDLLAQTGATLLPGLPAEREERLLSVWRYFEDGHVAIPRAPSRDLERLLTALACLALAALSARLPQKDRRADPREVFEAFADLDALAEFRGERIRIRLPLGQRYFALEKAGLLHPFPGAAWLAGRTVEFSRG
jgi:hypothetical protein